MDVMWPLCREPQSNINVTPAALFRAIDEKQCTLFLDEADNWANKRGPVVSILNAGHTVFRRANLTPEPGDRRPKLTP